MMNRRIAAVLLGGLVLAPVSSMAQSINMAYASGQSRTEYMVFLDKGSEISDPAAATIRKAARTAGPNRTIHVIGHAQHAQLVKQELVRDGVAPSSIVITNEALAPIARVNDGIGSPDDRGVAIKF
ncbi:MAG: hypothetical protein U1E60_11845 [Reyranellaceae bacterium]